jgi:phospholipid/cholesterol/gamma-HCH transport system ATP-binding protein
MNPIITVKNLSVSYDKTLIIDAINFVVYPGEVFMIIGGSGGGKTTLLNSMIGLHEELTGNIIIDGNDITTAFDQQKHKILKKIGVMYQSGALFGSLTLLENVMFPLEELSDLPKSAIYEIALTKLAMVGLSSFADYMPAAISGGMLKRAAIARAMVLEPTILFLDEPSSGLDPVTSVQIDDLIKMLSQSLGITFVIVSHEIASIYNIATRVILLHNKKIVAEGDPKKLDQEHRDINDPVFRFFNRRA